MRLFTIKFIDQPEPLEVKCFTYDLLSGVLLLYIEEPTIEGCGARYSKGGEVWCYPLARIASFTHKEV